MKPKPLLIGLIITLFSLVIHFFLINDYGLTWDFHHIFFAGLKFIRHPITVDMTAHIPFGKPSPWDMFDVPFGQLMPAISALSWSFIHEKWQLLPFDSAFHAATVFLGSIGPLFLFLLLNDAYNLPVAVLGSLFLILYPRYFADTQNNIKDIPQVVFFALTILLIWKMIKLRKPVFVILAALSFAVAFNIKINSIFIPAVFIVWIITLLITRAKSVTFPQFKFNFKSLFLASCFLLLASCFAFGLWFLTWDNPMHQLFYIPTFFQENTKNMEVLFNGAWYCSTVNIPWWYPWGYLSIVTPLPVLILAIIGLILTLIDVKNRKPAASLLLIWFLIPLSRFFLPHTAVIDGIRHFEEVVYPLCAFSAIGTFRLISLIMRKSHLTHKTKVLLASCLLFIVFCPLVYNIISYHPFQITYFNELVGGVKGASNRFDLDYWGTSQKAAIYWINKNAPPNTYVYVVMVPDVAAKYLRPDLLKNLNTKERDSSDYVVVLNRLSFFYRYFYTVEYMLRHKVVHTIDVKGVSLVFIFDNRLGQTPRRSEWWTREDPCVRKYWLSPWEQK